MNLCLKTTKGIRLILVPLWLILLGVKLIGRMPQTCPTWRIQPLKLPLPPWRTSGQLSKHKSRSSADAGGVSRPEHALHFFNLKSLSD